MAMAVHHGLPARFAHGKPDVVAVRPERFFNYLFAFTDEIDRFTPLINPSSKRNSVCAGTGSRAGGPG
jgi:hypothetical protein